MRNCCRKGKVLIKMDKLNYIPQRLRDARIASGQTIKSVAEQLGITSQAVSLFERGSCTASAEKFFQLKNIYGFPLSFYQSANLDSINRGAVFFRKFSAATKHEREQSLKIADMIVANVVGFFADKIKLPHVDKSFGDIKTSVNIEKKREPELWAKLVRRAWKLPAGPISNLILEAERRGILVVVIPLDSQKVDGFSFWEGGRPYIFANTNNSPARLRMSIAHEICHLYFHNSEMAEDDLKMMEEEAKAFAGAFLLPQNEFISDIISSSLNTFRYLKPKWKVSIAAMVLRAKELEIISDDKYEYLQKQISRKHWRKVEPGDNDMNHEKPVLLKQSIELLVNNRIFSRRDIVDSISLPADLVEEAVSLPKGYFDKERQLVSKV